MSKHAQAIEAARKAYLDALEHKPFEIEQRYRELEAAVKAAKAEGAIRGKG